MAEYVDNKIRLNISYKNSSNKTLWIKKKKMTTPEITYVVDRHIALIFMILESFAILIQVKNIR